MKFLNNGWFKFIFNLIFVGILVMVIVSPIQTKSETKSEVQQQLDEIFKNLAAINTSISILIDNHQQINHYFSGHKSTKLSQQCVECGLLKELRIRQLQIEEELVKLSAEPDKYQEKIDRLSIEQRLLSRHLYSSDKMSEEIDKIVKELK